MANARRGEIAARFDGADWRLCLTLGALAELETAFGAEGLTALARRFEEGRVGARDLARVIATGLRGAGHPVSDEEALRLTHEDGLPGFVSVVARLFEATFGAPAPNPPAPQATA